MTEPFLGEVRIFAGNFAPVGWSFCNGTLLPIGGNEALYTLLGTTYGGDGTTTFGLPDLRGRAALSLGRSTASPNTTYAAGQKGGAETVALAVANIPPHIHTTYVAPANATTTTAGGGVVLAAAIDATAGQTDARYLPDGQTISGAAQALNSGEVTFAAGGTTPLNNMMPSLAINYIIAVQGLFPQPA